MMLTPDHHIKYSPFESGASANYEHSRVNGRNSADLATYIEELKKANEEIRASRRAALNVMEDAILSREALRQSEEKYRTRLERDVLDRTAELKANKELLQATMNSSMDMIQVFEAVRNEQGEIVDFKWILNNHTSEKFYGDVIGKSLLTLNPGVVTEGIFDIFKQVVETGVPDQRERFYAHEQFNGWFYQSVVKLGDGIATTTADISERKKAEEQVKKQTNYIERITQTMPAMISVTELQTGKVEYINSTVFIAEGFSPEQMMKTQVSELRKAIHEDDHQKMNDYYARCAMLKDDEATSIDYRSKNNTGYWHWYRARGKVFRRDAKSNVTHIINIVENITKEKEAEETIQQLNKTLIIKNRELESVNTEIKTFNSIAATDYKETLKQLYTNLEFIITHDARNLSDPSKANIRRAQAGIQKMKLLTDDIVNFFKIQSLDNVLTSVDLNEIVHRTLQDMREKIIEANAQTQVAALPTNMQGYPLLLSLLFHHLIDNALKFRNPDTRVHISISYEQVTQPPVENAITGIDYHKISVTDNGIGFDESEATNIFNMFYRLHDKTKYRGSGVGLAICKKIMDLHYGLIVAESHPGKGASFSCFFPPPQI